MTDPIISNWDLIPANVFIFIMYSLYAGFCLAVFHNRETIGSNPECNGAARLFFFGTIDVSVSPGSFIATGILDAISIGLLLFPRMMTQLLSLAKYLLEMGKLSKEERREVHRRIDELVCSIY